MELSLHVAPPELPADLLQIQPVTFLVCVTQVTSGRVTNNRHVVSQTSDRVHVTQPNGQEWLFERNSVDTRRVSGFLCHHDTRTIIVHEACDLLCWLDIRGWFDVVAFAGHRGALGRLLAAQDGVPGHVSVESTRASVNPTVLQPPYVRFPNYRLMDLGEWFTG